MCLFESEFQLLQIGGYYIFKHHIENCFCTTKDSKNVGNAKIPAKIPVSSKTRMWSLTFSTDEVVTYNRSPSNGDSSFSSHEALAVDKVELLLHGLSDSYLGKSSDVHLFLSANAKDILKVKLKDLEEDFIKPSVGPDQTSNISSCTRTTLNVPGLSYGPLDSSFLVPEGNLISLHGDVVAVHGFDDSSVSEHLSGESLSDVLQFGFFQELGKTFCIHVLVDHKPVIVYYDIYLSFFLFYCMKIACSYLVILYFDWLGKDFWFPKRTCVSNWIWTWCKRNISPDSTSKVRLAASKKTYILQSMLQYFS